MSVNEQKRLQPESANSEITSIVQAFEQVAAQHPNRPAVWDGKQTLTYTQLNQTANCLANQLIKQLAAGPELVTFLLGHKVNSVQAVWGILKSGKGFVALDPTSTIEKSKAILINSDSRILITDTQHLTMAQSVVHGTNVSLINLDKLNKEPCDNLNLTIDPNAYAVALYTSGSTGEPKGLLRTFQTVLYRHPYDPNFLTTDRVMLPGFLGYSQNQYAMFVTLRSGACIYLYDIRAQGGIDLPNWVETNQISILVITPSLFRSGFNSAPAGKTYPSVRTLQLGGEAATKQDLDIFKRCFVSGAWGVIKLASTETGLISSFKFDHTTEVETAIMPVGKVIAGKTVLLLNEENRPVEQGQIGEIVVKAKAFNTQYWKNPNLSNEKIKPDPADSSMSLFYTGDLGRFREDGLLEHHGRKDSMIKVNGQRVDTKEIEAIIKEHPSINAVAVTTRPFIKNSTRLQMVVYYTLNKDSLSPTEIRSHLHKRMPNLLASTVFINIPSIPLNPNGKTDYQALASIKTKLSTTTPYQKPATEIEEKLTAIWKKIFKKAKLSVTENFFDLGGDSLMAMQLLVEIEKEYARQMPLSIITKASTIREQARILENKEALNAAPILIPVQTNGKKNPLYCLPGVGGNTLKFHPLIKYLPKNQPVYFLRSRGLEAGETIETSIEAIAADYLLEIKRIQKNGPYHFIGFSSGGLVAYEMAQQLKQQGEETNLIAALDSYLAALQDKRSLAGQLLALINRNIKIWQQNGFRFYLTYLIEYVIFAITRLIQKQKEKEILAQRTDVYTLYKKVEKINDMAAQAYTPKPYTEKVLLFGAIKGHLKFEEKRPDLSWKRLEINTLDVQLINCYHHDILSEPYVQQIAEKIIPLLPKS